MNRRADLHPESLTETDLQQLAWFDKWYRAALGDDDVTAIQRLAAAGLVDELKQGRCRCYRINDAGREILSGGILGA